MHRRALLRVMALVAGGVVVGALMLSPDPAVDDPVVPIPDDHRVLSLPIDEHVPPLHPGDLIDLYVSAGTVAGVDEDVVALDEPGRVISVGEDAFSLAVVNDEVGVVADALNTGTVLVVRRG